MYSKIGLARLKKEYEGVVKDPPPNAVACPDPKNWFHWHFAVYGLDAPFAGGVYHGELRFPTDYPLGPPSILMHTPNGRFEIEKKICTTMSDFHKETWSPIWKVSTIIIGLISFMQSDERSTGCIATTNAQKQHFARNSRTFNMKNPKFVELFSPYFDTLFINEGEIQENEGSPRKTESFSNTACALAVILLLFYWVIAN